MASEEEDTSDSVSVRQIPGHLLNYLRLRILHYVAEESEFTAEIHQDAEQPARLVFSMGSKPQSKLEMEEQNTNDENGSTNVILVQNFPSLLDEEFLELFFESTKKKGGGPVRNVKLNRQKNWALVEFVEPEGVQTVLSKRPITMLDATLDIQPYAPLIQGGEQMKNVEIRGLRKALTKDLQDMHLESIIDPSAVTDTTDRDAVSKSKEANKHRASTVKSLGPVNTSASTSVDIKPVPSNLLNYLRSKVLHYFADVNDFSAEIQQISGQPSQLIVSVGNKATRVQSDLLNAEGDINSTKTILVQNIPSSLDEDMIEAFFESTKKGGGGPVNKLELNIEKHWAVVEFSDPKAVRNVMNNRPIKMLGTTVDVQPYAPLLQDDGTIDGLCITGLPTELTEDVIAAHLENMVTMSAAGADQVAEDKPCAGETVTETFSVADSVKLRMLQECKFQEELDQRFRPIKTTLNKKNLKIEVTFYRYDTKAIQSAKMYINQTLHKIDLCLLSNISQNCLDLFQFKQTTDDISNKLKTEKLVCVWEARASLLAVCSFSEDISACVDIIAGSVKEKQIPVPTLVPSFSIQSRSWQDMVAAVQDKFKGLCKIGVSEDSSEIYVTATDNVVEKILEEIQTYLKRYGTIGGRILMPFSDTRTGELFDRSCQQNIFEVLKTEFLKSHLPADQKP